MGRIQALALAAVLVAGNTPAMAAHDNGHAVPRGYAWGHDRDRDRGRRDDRRGRGGEAYRAGFKRGFSEGAHEGAKDGRRGSRFEYDRDSRYRDSDRGYRSSYGSRRDYEQGYKSGYREGYTDGYERKTEDGYGRWDRDDRRGGYDDCRYDKKSKDCGDRW
jgi:hypothetical protein